MSDRLYVLRRRLEAVSAKSGHPLTTLGGPEGIFQLRVRPQSAQRGRLCLVAGIHGDEPAGVEALLRTLEADAFPPGLSIDCFPCMNPEGYAANTRVNAAGLDLNRHFGLEDVPSPLDAYLEAIEGREYDMFVDLHEDDRASGFYVMELVGARGCVSEQVAAAVAAAGFALQPGPELTALMDAEGIPHGRCPLTPGRVVHRLDEAPQAGTAQAIYMRARHADHSLTFESPSGGDWEARVAMQVAGLRYLFAAVTARGHLGAVAHAPCP